MAKWRFRDDYLFVRLFGLIKVDINILIINNFILSSYTKSFSNCIERSDPLLTV